MGDRGTTAAIIALALCQTIQGLVLAAYIRQPHTATLINAEMILSPRNLCTALLPAPVDLRNLPPWGTIQLLPLQPKD